MIRSLKLYGSLPVLCRALSSPVTIATGRGGRSSTSSQTVTVFGATGYLGKFLINNLGATGTQLIIPHRCEPAQALPLKVSSDLGQQHHVYMPDMNDISELEQLVKYSDVVVNLTGSAEKELHRTMLESNVHLTHKIARACKNQNVPCFIHASHISARGHNPAGDELSRSIFITMKGLSETVVRHELPVTSIIVRSADVFHRESIFTSHLYKCIDNKGRIKLYEKGLKTFHHQIYAPDFMKGIAKIIRAKPQDREAMYQFTGPERLSLNETAKVLLGAPNFEVKSRPMSDFRTMNGLFVKQYKKEHFIRYQVCSDLFTEGLPGLKELGITPVDFRKKAETWRRQNLDFWSPDYDMNERDIHAGGGIKIR